MEIELPGAADTEEDTEAVSRCHPCGAALPPSPPPSPPRTESEVSDLDQDQSGAIELDDVVGAGLEAYDPETADNGSKFADLELEAINAKFNITIKDASFFLGNNINCTSRSSVSLTSRAYIARIAEKYLLHDIKSYPPYVTPCDKTIVSAYEEALSSRVEIRANAERTFLEKYASKVGALIYVVPVCRVDCAFAIGVLARCLTFPTEAMDSAADRCLAYLAQNPEVGLHYDANASRPDLHAYSDSNWTVGHSTSGWAILYAGAVIGYGSKRQQSIALSSTEAEIMAASQAATEIMYFRGLLFELGRNLDTSPPSCTLTIRVRSNSRRT